MTDVPPLRSSDGGEHDLEALSAVLHRMPYHVGIAARSFEDATRTLGSLFGCAWEDPFEDRSLSFMTPEGPVTIEASTAHTRGGPMRVEVCVGTFWPVEGDRQMAIHHYGFWSADVGAEVSQLASMGWQAEAWAVDAEGRPANFAYLSKPNLGRLELIDARRQPQYCQRVGATVPLTL
jgi:hypothetical protein